uniref:Uncharacterized protein n=1 Tax=Ditylenchus dipsaci TaxID=166011 RepID=A0A915EMF8_9BILA
MFFSPPHSASNPYSSSSIYGLTKTSLLLLPTKPASRQHWTAREKGDFQVRSYWPKTQPHSGLYTLNRLACQLTFGAGLEKYW